MRVVHLSSSDINGGAARAAFSVHKALSESEIGSKMLVQQKLSDDPNTFSVVNNTISKTKFSFRFLLDYLTIKFLTNESRGRFSFPSWGIDLSNHQLIKEADVIQLHWINQAFLSLKNLQQLFSLNKPIVWTMHDMWAFTGGCHYNSDCLRFSDVCNNCPALKFPGNSDFSNKIFKQKLALFNKYKINVVTSSNWLADEVKRSTLLKGQYINVIPTPISIDTFKPLDKIEARKKFNIRFDKFIILFGTMNLNDERKGFTQLQNSLILLYERYPELREKVELLVFGKSENEQMNRIPFKINNAGKINSNKNLAQAYNSADVFVAPSLQDNLPNTVMESLACGIPAVVFNIGGMPDIVDHKLNGFLATPYSVEGLTDGIKWFFNELSDGKSYANDARKKVLDNFTAEKITEKYRVFYKSLLNRKS